MMDAEDVIWSLDQTPVSSGSLGNAAEAPDGRSNDLGSGGGSSTSPKNVSPTLGVTTLTSTSSSNLFAVGEQDQTDQDTTEGIFFHPENDRNQFYFSDFLRCCSLTPRNTREADISSGKLFI